MAATGEMFQEISGKFRDKALKYGGRPGISTHFGKDGL